MATFPYSGNEHFFQMESKIKQNKIFYVNTSKKDLVRFLFFLWQQKIKHLNQLENCRLTLLIRVQQYFQFYIHKCALKRKQNLIFELRVFQIKCVFHCDVFSSVTLTAEKRSILPS